MKKILVTIFLSAFTLSSLQAQDATYHKEREKINDLVHTKLKVSFDFAKMQMPAEAWITLKPHFYPSSKVTLDAKMMDIQEVKRNGKKLKYTYDDKQLQIDLGNSYAQGEEFTVYIKYIARPEEIKDGGSAAITSDKGLYFIDADETNPNKPTEIWTQGETEASSVWFPTIDSPNQKTTQEIYMTVDSKFVTLSNGILTSQIENGNGTRTDYWKMDLKHAPYLFFMGVGEFSIVKDMYKNIPVDYYVDKEFEPYAREIFGNTPEMLEFFETKLGVDYPWPKYAQMVAYDYVSGAMENTTATLHGTTAYQTSGQLVDNNAWEDVIAHELFHHWFGDLVTAESWSNLTVNESFANYSEYLWREYKYGKDHADAHRHKDLKGYYNGGNEEKDLVRFDYIHRMDMFDAVSYNKGGGILHMLRNQLGDEAFFAGLKYYLEENKFGTAEAHQLRIALEKVTGKDLNHFFNQWYFNNGHLDLDIKYGYDEANGQATVQVNQNGKVFEMPVKINVYENDQPKTYTVNLKKAEEIFAFKTSKEPKFIDFDVSKSLVSIIKDNKSNEYLINQYYLAPTYENRKESIDKLAGKKDENIVKLFKDALSDKYFGLKILALKNIDLSDSKYKGLASKVKELISKDKKTLVRAAAMKTYQSKITQKDMNMLESAMANKSFSLKKAALSNIYKLDKQKAISYANQITDKHTKENMLDGLLEIYINEKMENQYPFIAKNIIKGMFMSQDPDKQKIYGEAFQLIAKSGNKEATQNFVDDAVKMGLQYKQYGADKMLVNLLRQMAQLQGATSHANKEELKQIATAGIKKLQ